MKRNKRKNGFIAKPLIFIFLLLLIILSYKVWLVLPAKFLLVRDRIGKADCIVPLRADTYFRFKKAMELYNASYAKTIVLSCELEKEEELKEYYNFDTRILGLKDISSRELALAALKYFGKDAQGVYFTTIPVSSTYDEAAAVKKLMLDKKFKSLILVTSTYHARRALLIFRLVFRGTGIRIYNCTADNKLYNPARWWLKERDVDTVLREYMAIVYNVFYHFLFKKGRTPFDT